MHFLACFWVESSSTVPSDPFSALPSLFCPLIQRQQINSSDRVVVRASGLELYEHALMDLWFTSWHLVWSFWCLIACVQQMVRRSARTTEEARADAITCMSGTYDTTRKCHTHPDASFSWSTPRIAKIEESMRATLNDVVHVQRTACSRCCL